MRATSSSSSGRKVVEAVAQAEDEDEGDTCKMKGQPVGRPRGKTIVSQRVDGDEGLDETGEDGNNATPAPGRPRGRRASGTVQTPAAAPVAPSKDGRKRRRDDD